MAITPSVLLCQADTFNDPVVIEQFLRNATYVTSFDYQTPLGQAGALRCPIRLPNGQFLFSFEQALAVKLSASLAYVSSQGMIDPTPGNSGAPAFFTNIQSGGTRVIGAWQNVSITPPFPVVSVLQDINPATYGQTTLWTNWAPLYMGDQPPVYVHGMDRAGTKVFYSLQVVGDASGVIYAVDLATGVTSSFIAQYATGAIPNHNDGTYAIWQLPDLTYLVLWEISSGVEYRITQYTSAGVQGGMNIDITDIALPCFGIEPAGGAVWICGYNLDAADGTYLLRRYLVPSGAVSVESAPPQANGPDDTFPDLLVADVNGPALTTMAADCDADPITIVITGSALTNAAVDDLVGPDGPTTFTIASQTDTEIVLDDLDPVFTPGEYTVKITPPGQPQQVLTVFLACTVPPPTPGTARLIRRLRVFPLPFDRNLRLSIPRIEVIPQPGVGTTGQGADPQLIMRVSKDGGKTYGTEISMSVGKVGEYLERWYVNRLGQGRNWVIELSATDPVVWSLLACYVDLSPGSN